MSTADETPDATTPDATTPDGPTPARPVLRVVRGEPTAEELAVLTALASAAGGEDDVPPPPQRGRWNDPAWTHRRPLAPGPGGWRSAAH